MDDKNKIPTNQGLQRFAATNRADETPLFATLGMFDGERDPKTKTAIPSDMAVEQAKDWVDNGSKL